MFLHTSCPRLQRFPLQPEVVMLQMELILDLPNVGAGVEEEEGEEGGGEGEQVVVAGERSIR